MKETEETDMKKVNIKEGVVINLNDEEVTITEVMKNIGFYYKNKSGEVKFCNTMFETLNFEPVFEQLLSQDFKEANNMSKKELVIVTVSYSFDAEVVAIIFDDYKKASEYIKEDFENEKKIDTKENGWEIDEESTYCEENMAVLSTIYNGETETTIWTIARVIDNR